VWKGIAKKKEEKLTVDVGVSNFYSNQLKTLLKLCEEHKVVSEEREKEKKHGTGEGGGRKEKVGEGEGGRWG